MEMGFLKNFESLDAGLIEVLTSYLRVKLDYRGYG
jgi:hypothetical protein